jgi:hypothetical protein
MGVMLRTALRAAAAGTLLWPTTALATPTPQQLCDSARITAWKSYLSCVDGVLAKNARGALVDLVIAFPAFAKCRHQYFANWVEFQGRNSLAGSTCIGSRFTSTDSGTTVTDALTSLVWEKKTNFDSVANPADPHDADNTYSWSTTGPPYAESGTTFTDFLATLNSGGFAGANGWRLPTLAELQTILLDFPCRAMSNCGSCGANPCIDPAFDPTQNSLPGNGYWSATSWLPGLGLAWSLLLRWPRGARHAAGRLELVEEPRRLGLRPADGDERGIDLDVRGQPAEERQDDLIWGHRGDHASPGVRTEAPIALGTL